MSWFPIVIALVLGLAFGSFMTVAIHRVPAGESLVRPRSRCPSCGGPIRSADNIPVISWLMLRGRCRACGVRISPVYPLTELACGGLFVAVALVYEDPWRAVLLAPFAGLMVGDVLRHLIAATIILALGLILGYRPGSGLPGIVGAFALLIAIGFGTGWVFMLLGLLIRTPTTVVGTPFNASA